MIALAAVPLVIWIYLLLGRGMFWRMRERDECGADSVQVEPHAPLRLAPLGTSPTMGEERKGAATCFPPPTWGRSGRRPGRGKYQDARFGAIECRSSETQINPQHWPSVSIVIPARDESDVIGRTIESLLAQDYQGRFHIILVDDRSSDGTAEAARRAALACGMSDRMEIISGQERPSGWTGKVWAMRQGFARAQQVSAADYVFFTDADIAHAPDNLRCLVSRAEDRRLVLVSLMAKLHCENFAEKLLIPAFVFLFAMLFPFGWANDARRGTAAAAGGCMLVRRDALVAAGGLEAIAREIIDDCALARILKRQGPIWLGLTRRAQSIRPYGGMDEIGRMVARSAYAQLHYSPVLLCGTVLGMIIVYAAPPLLALFAPMPARIMGAAAWLLMGLVYQPMLRFYRLSPLWGAALPAIGALYAGFTVNSAVQHWRGRGGMWKGRAQAMA